METSPTAKKTQFFFLFRCKERKVRWASREQEEEGSDADESAFCSGKFSPPKAKQALFLTGGLVTPPWEKKQKQAELSDAVPLQLQKHVKSSRFARKAWGGSAWHTLRLFIPSRTMQNSLQQCVAATTRTSGLSTPPAQRKASMMSPRAQRALPVTTPPQPSVGSASSLTPFCLAGLAGNSFSRTEANTL